MGKWNRVLLMLIAMTAIMIMAAGIDKGMKYYEQKRWESEREVFYEEARADIAKMQTTIQTLSEDPEALTVYIAENGLNYVESREAISKEADEAPQRLDSSENSVSENAAAAAAVFKEAVSENMMPENTAFESSVPGNPLSGNSVSGNSVSGNSVSDNSVSDNSVSDNAATDALLSNSVSGNLIWENGVPENSVSGNRAEQKELCASYEETIKINHADKAVIANSTIDFSDKKIVCFGDSITAAANLAGEEDYLKLSYPYQLGEILAAREVVNLGIGGSSIGRYWENAFVDRYREIPEDADIILVMGGTNDGFCATEADLGSLEEREKGTFAGDLDELLRNLKEEYQDAEIILITPLSNVLHDMLRKSRDYLLPQSSFVAVMKQLAEEYEIPVIDLYNSGILDSHDAAVIHSFIPDGVHGNELGYRILAEHIAAELIQLQEEKNVEPEDAETDEQ